MAQVLSVWLSKSPRPFPALYLLLWLNRCPWCLLFIFLVPWLNRCPWCLLFIFLVPTGIRAHVPDWNVCTFGHIWLFATPRFVARQVPLSVGFPGKNTGVGLPFPSPEDLPTQGLNSSLLLWQGDSLPQSLRGSHVLDCSPLKEFAIQFLTV